MRIWWVLCSATLFVREEMPIGAGVDPGEREYRAASGGTADAMCSLSDGLRVCHATMPTRCSAVVVCMLA